MYRREDRPKVEGARYDFIGEQESITWVKEAACACGKHVMRVLDRNHTVRPCNEGVADLGGGDCKSLVHEKPNIKRQDDATLSMVLMFSLICSLTYMPTLNIRCLTTYSAVCCYWS